MWRGYVEGRVVASLDLQESTVLVADRTEVLTTCS
jgi:hypothetical protein